jgi:hypothetical protein
MTFLSIAEATKLIGKSRATLYRYIDEGKLSTSVDDLGKRKIETSELLRVFGEFSKKDNETVSERQNLTPRDTNLSQRLRDAAEHIRWLTAQLDEEKARSRRLEEEKEREREHSRELERLMLAVGSQQRKPGIFERIFGNRRD